MGAGLNRGRLARWSPIAGLALVVAVLVVVLGVAASNSVLFGRYYALLLIAGGLGLAVMMAVIVTSLLRLLGRVRRGEPGARLSFRLLVLFVVIAAVPVSAVFGVSLQFLHRAIDSWFDVDVQAGLDDALELSRSSMDLRMRESLKLTLRIADAMAEINEALAPLALEDFRDQTNASELVLITSSGRIIGTASSEALSIVPDLPPEPVLMYVRQGNEYVSLDPSNDRQFQVRAVVNLPRRSPMEDPLILQALYPVPDRFGRLADSTQATFDRYRQLVFLRDPLKTSFTVALSLILAFAVLTAVLAALAAARRLVEPIRDLAEGTRAVALGQYDKQLPPSTGNDELGFLVQSFNQMTRKLAQARDAAEHSQGQLERQRAYLEAVLARLSSGVLTLNRDGTLRTYNDAACQILGNDLAPWLGHRLLDPERPAEGLLGALVSELKPHLEEAAGDWRQEITQFGGSGRQVLMCRGSAMSDAEGQPVGQVVVFDDITALVQAERDAAWAEVARRLAHEIKNPLTPIQLSAERIRHKYLKHMDADEGRVLDRGTNTIIHQVQAMKEMVDVFNQYARPRPLELEPVDLNAFILDVMYLYGEYPAGIEIDMDLDPDVPTVEADPGRIRQLVHNLVKNALEALEEHGGGRLCISTRREQGMVGDHVELRFTDDGPGFPDALRANLFEPYVTTKPKGTGLGLAIVKKIVEEHGGMIELQSPPGGGACIAIRIPLKPPTHAASHAPPTATANEVTG